MIPGGGGGGGAGTSSAVQVDVAGEFAAVTEKTSTTGDDLLLVEDSAAAGVKKRVKASNVTVGNATTETGDHIGIYGFDGPLAKTARTFTWSAVAEQLPWLIQIRPCRGVTVGTLGQLQFDAGTYVLYGTLTQFASASGVNNNEIQWQHGAATGLTPVKLTKSLATDYTNCGASASMKNPGGLPGYLSTATMATAALGCSAVAGSTSWCWEIPYTTIVVIRVGS